jgi:hypothetical protein
MSTLTTIYCDDIREEVGGKSSYMGVYAGDLIISAALPVLLPKLCIILQYKENFGESNEPVNIKVFAPGLEEPIVDLNIPMDEGRRIPLATDVPAEDQHLLATVPLVIAPFPLNSEGRIKVRAYRGSEIIKGGALRIVARPGLDPPKQ